jgi:predicted PurR-regulated permease PerM
MSTLTPTPTPKLPIQRQTQAGVTILAVAAAVALLYFGRVFFITMVVAITIAFLLDPLLTPFLKLRMPRAVASFIVCSIALLALYLLGLGLYTQFSGFVEELPAYSQRMNDMVDNVATRVDEVEKRTYQVVIPKRFQEVQPPNPVPEVARVLVEQTA